MDRGAGGRRAAPVSAETLEWIEEQQAAEPPPVSEETLQWIEEQQAAEPPPVSEETLEWIEEQERAESDPPPISDELQQWLDEHEGGGPSSPPPSAPAATPAPSAAPCGWSIDQRFGGGRIRGRHCGAVPGRWIVDGTYDVGGFVGTQKWKITIGADERTGTFTYNVTSKGAPFGSPVTVYLLGFANGTVTLAIDPADGTARMVLTETKHTYLTTTDKGGSGNDQEAERQTYPLDWPADPAC